MIDNMAGMSCRLNNKRHPKIVDRRQQGERRVVDAEIMKPKSDPDTIPHYWYKTMWMVDLRSGKDRREERRGC